MSLEGAVEDIKALFELEPLIMKFINDAKGVTPQLTADGEAIISKWNAIFHPTPPANPPV